MPNLKQAAAALEEMADLLNLTEKSIASVARRFNRELKSLVSDAWNGSGTITRDMRQLVKQYVEDAYIEGLKEGNIPADEMTVDDAQMIDELNLTQQDYVPDFVKAIRDAQDDKAAQRDILDNRIPLWSASIEAAGMQGLASASANEMVEFGIAPGEEPSDESCPTCKRLMGKRMRRKTVVAKGLLIHPGNENYECGNWRCPHNWLPIK